MQIYYPIVHGKLSHEIWWLLPHCFTVISICIYIYVIWSLWWLLLLFLCKRCKNKTLSRWKQYLLNILFFVCHSACWLLRNWDMHMCFKYVVGKFCRKSHVSSVQTQTLSRRISSLFCILRHVVPLFVYSISSYTCPPACEAIEKCATTTTTTRRKW